MKLFPWSEIEQPESEKRTRLRAEVYAERSDFFYHKERFVPACPLCGRALADGFHMHEVLITRGGVPVAQQDAIWSKYNVILMCPRCHHRKGHSVAEECEVYVPYLIDWYGREAIEEWLQSLPFRVETNLDYYLAGRSYANGVPIERG
jgi:hypothetical protein